MLSVQMRMSQPNAGSQSARIPQPADGPFQGSSSVIKLRVNNDSQELDNRKAQEVGNCYGERTENTRQQSLKPGSTDAW